MKYSVDRSLCSGHGRCYTLAPMVYEPDGDGFNSRIGETADVPPGDEEAARLGITSCPEGAITGFG
jgi:ferredoxin